MPTLQFTFDKETEYYCLGFWKDGKFIVRNKTKQKNNIWQQFCQELSQLEGGNINDKSSN